MIEKCANSACCAIFRRLRDGRVFIREIEADPTSDAKESLSNLSVLGVIGMLDGTASGFSQSFLRSC